MLTHVWQKVRGFLIKAGTLILLMSMVLWLLQSFDFSLRMVEDAGQSMLGTLGSLIAPIFAPAASATGRAAVALLTGLVAKEMVVSSLSMFYGFSLTASSGAVAAAMAGFIPPVRLLHAGVHSAVRPLCGRRIHPVQGDEQPQVGLVLHRLAGRLRLCGISAGVSGGQSVFLNGGSGRRPL